MSILRILRDRIMAVRMIKKAEPPVLMSVSPDVFRGILEAFYDGDPDSVLLELRLDGILLAADSSIDSNQARFDDVHGQLIKILTIDRSLRDADKEREVPESGGDSLAQSGEASPEEQEPSEDEPGGPGALRTEAEEEVVAQGSALETPGA